MRIIETFLSIQGEGPHTGMPCFFVRTAGCNLECQWCDTGFARADSGREMSARQVSELYLESAGRMQSDRAGRGLLACVTGGEPMLQADLPDLMQMLIDSGAQVEMMTNGTCDLTRIPIAVSVVIDLKVAMLMDGWTPPAFSRSSHGADARPGPADSVKFVVRDRQEFDFAARWASVNGVFDRAGDVYVAPAWASLTPSVLAGWILESEPRFRLGLQVHKYVWGADTRM